MKDEQQPGSHDEFFRKVFDTPRIAQAFCRYFLDPRLVCQLDLGRLKVVKDSFVDSDLRSHYSDVLYTVPLIGSGRKTYVFILIEHKSASDEFVVFQLLRYMVRIWHRELETAKYKAGSRLPPIVPLVLHHGRTRFRGPVEFVDLVRSVSGMEPFVPRFAAMLVDLAGGTAEDVPADDPELFAVLSAMQAVHGRTIGKRLFDIFRRLAPNRERPEIKSLLDVISNYVAACADYLEPENLYQAFKILEKTGEELMTTCAQRWKAEGLEKGIEKGKSLGQAEAVVRVLEERCGPVPEAIAQSIRRISDSNCLDSLIAKAARCESLEDFVTFLGQ